MGELVNIDREKFLKGVSFGATDDEMGIFFSTNVFENDKAKKKFIINVESIVRKSAEYTRFIKYIRTELKMNSCAILNELSSKDVTVELHHAPFNLYEIVDTVVNRRMDKDEPITTYSVAEEVMLLHYSNMVGLIPLSKTMHEFAHSSSEFLIKPEMLIGEHREFFNQYRPYMEPKSIESYMEWMDEVETKSLESVVNNYSTTSKFSQYLTKVSTINTTEIANKRIIND